ncbi:MAG: hypothetical protein KGZ96_04375 [Clostridia bacterium]|nr:hypothetical protein [Clostridia bacterium]
MFQFESYLAIALTITGGALTLLGSVGIFVSLIVQRRVERLQDILEEFMDLSYHQSINLTGQMYKLLQKYQMQYMLPDKPSQMILYYIDLTTLFVIASWLVLILMTFSPPWGVNSLLYILPLIWGLILLTLFRQLLKYAINPVKNQLLQTIIPPPTKLRSISFISSYINVSILSILYQARLALVIRLNVNAYYQGKSIPGEVVLKQELSFDDFFYYLQITHDKTPVLLGYGELEICFPDDPLTGKPVPIQRNVNIPLGKVTLDPAIDTLDAEMLIFARGEKHPLKCLFQLHKEGKVFCPDDEPVIRLYSGVTYKISQDRLELLENQYQSAWLEQLSPKFLLNNQRFYLTGKTLTDPINPDCCSCCDDKVYIK